MGEGSPKTEMINPALLDGVSANFIVKGPSGVEKAYPMRTLVVTIGRSDQCEIAVKDGSMSGKHAEVSKINGEIKVKDLGSANGIYVNGEKTEEAELYDGDILRLGQTSIRVDIVGGKIRPGSGMSPKLAIGIIVGALVLAAAAVAIVLVVKKKGQRKHDIASAHAFIAAARDGQKSPPCSAAAVEVGSASKLLNTLPKRTCSRLSEASEGQRIANVYKDLEKTYNRMVNQLNAFAATSTQATQSLSSAVEGVVTPEIKAKMVEAQEQVEERGKVTTTFINDWRKLAKDTGEYARNVEAAAAGNRGLCPVVEKGIVAKSPAEIMVACRKGFDKAKVAVDDKLKELEDQIGPAEAKAE
jgi:pSer/pThr/pTyr-binding forkhead associated (FHA) protein